MTIRKLVLPAIFGLLLGLSLILAACGEPSATPTAVPATPTPAPAATSTPEPATSTPMPMATSTPTAISEDTIAEGKAIFARSCAICHGPEGDGTALAPMVAGHSTTAVKLQVRNPVGTMPAFAQGQLSDADLNKVAAFISSLGEAKAPPMEWEKAAPETIHLWMAMLAIKTDDMENARHHLQDALDFAQDPARKQALEEAMQMMAMGNMHDAEHEIEEMAGSESPSGIPMQRFHLILAMRAVEDREAAEVRHHLDHFAVEATEGQKELVNEALEKMGTSDFHGAEHEIEELMDSVPHSPAG